MNSKHPVSYLQEEMQKLGKAPPLYKIISCEGGFYCEVTVGDISSSAVAASKQIAKFQAAAKAAEVYMETQSNLKHISQNISCSSTHSQSTSTNSSDISQNISELPENTSFLLNSSQDVSFNSSFTTLAKHPISELQELLVGQRKSPPNYEIIDKSTPYVPSFKCRLTIEGKTYEFEANSKKTARTEVAKMVLNDLRGKFNSSLNLNESTSSNSAVSNEVTYNAIGTLNEFLQKCNLACADYTEMGVNNLGEFVIFCKAMGKSCEGCGNNKKQAKQIAAHNMIKLLDIHKIEVKPFMVIPPTIVQPTVSNSANLQSEIVKLNDVSDDDIINKFKELHVKFEPVLDTNDSEDHSLSKDENTTTTTTTTTTTEDVSESDLVESLNKLKCPYSYGVIQEDKQVVIMRLVFKDSLPTTILSHGSNYMEAKMNLLKQALKIKTELINL